MGTYFAAQILELEDAANKGKLCPCDTYFVKRELANVREHAAEIRQQLEEVPEYTGRLRRLEKGITQGPQLQRHRLGSAWSEEEQKGLDALLETLDITPPHNEWMKGTTCIPAVKDARVYNTGKNLYALPNFFGTFEEPWKTVGSALSVAALIGGIGATALGAGMLYGTLGKQYGMFGDYTLPQLLLLRPIFGSIAFFGGSTVAVLALLTIVRNPFSSLANEMEKRRAYVQQYERALFR